MKQILFLFAVFIAFSCQKQQEKNNAKVNIVKLPPPPKVIDEKTLVGFACYHAGENLNLLKKYLKF